MKILSNYIFKHLAHGLITVTLVLAGVAWLTQFLRLFGLVLERGLSLWSFISLTVLLLPQIITIVIPIAVFAVVLFIYHKFVMDKELLVMQAGGASRGQLARPALWLGGILFIYLLFSSHILEPWANQQFKNKQFSFRNDLASLVIKEDSFNTLIPNLTIYVEKTNNNILYNLILHDNRVPERTYTVFAKKGEFVQTQKGLSVALAQGSLQENKNGEIIYGDFKNFTVDLGILEEKKERRVKPKELFSTTLLRPSENIDQRTHNEYMAEFHRRNLVAFWPILSICLALIGLFLGSITGRSKGNNILVTSIAFVGLEALLLTSINLLKKNIALAGAIYGMHILFLIAGLAFLWSTRGKKK
ncbi:MAG: LptF/LptG family permease [Alphaproteobacteria bacterium]|nr:LptF/LptG family permease [Alphaproteobacteria bacterium]MBN2779493.1 LptF/LptG family permease [Alphaproteobacteria bacterium]